jgi:hypothetical protein
MFMIVNARLGLVGAAAIPLLAAAFAWAPTAHAAGPGPSLPTLPSPPATVPQVTRVVAREVSSVAARVTPAANAASRALRHVTKAVSAISMATQSVARVVPPSAVKASSPPATAPHAASRASTRPTDRERPDRTGQRAAARPRAPLGMRADSRSDQTSAAPIVTLPRPSPLSGPLSVSGAGAAGAASGFAPLLALAAALLALAGPGRGRRMLQSIVEGRACALTLDLERPD